MNLVSSLPAKTVCQVSPGNRSSPVFKKSLLLILRDDDVRVDFKKLVGVDCKLSEKVRRILVHPSKPHGTDDGFYPFHLRDFLAVGDGQNVGQRNLVPGD